jgi:hypothetical protein
VEAITHALTFIYFPGLSFRSLPLSSFPLSSSPFFLSLLPLPSSSPFFLSLPLLPSFYALSSPFPSLPLFLPSTPSIFFSNDVFVDVKSNSRKESRIVNSKTGRFFEVDVWLPNLQLGFEFQVCHAPPIQSIKK